MAKSGLKFVSCNGEYFAVVDGSSSEKLSKRDAITMLRIATDLLTPKQHPPKRPEQGKGPFAENSKR